MLQARTAQARTGGGPIDAYRRLFEVCQALRVQLLTDDQEPGPGLLRAARLPERLPALVAAESERLYAGSGHPPRPHVAAARLLHHYLWSASLLISGPWYLVGRVPKLPWERVCVDLATGELALWPAEAEPGGPAELRAAVAEHVEPVLAAFQPYLRRGPRALWGMAADDLVSGIWHLGRTLGEEDRAVALASSVLPGGTPPFPGAADFRRLPGTDGRVHHTRTRRGCCLNYAIRPDAACVTCPRTGDAERVRRLEA